MTATPPTIDDTLRQLEYMFVDLPLGPHARTVQDAITHLRTAAANDAALKPAGEGEGK